MANYRLNLISNPDVNEPGDFEQLADWIRAQDGEIDVVLSGDETPRTAQKDARAIPNLTFSPAPLRWFRPERGPVLQGQLMAKSAEYQRLDAIDVPVPKWALLTVTQCPDCAAFGPYVVIKPDYGGRGADVRIAKTNRIRWRHPTTSFARMLGGVFAPYVVQEFIYTGQWPVSYRVGTLFGEALWCHKMEADHSRVSLPSRFGFGDLGSGVGVSIVSSGKGCTYEIADETEIIDLAERAHQAFPDIGLLGVDVLRDAESGRLFVAEVNSLGYTWHFSSPSGRAIQQQFGLSLELQMDGRRKAARILAEQTRRLAS